MSSLLDAADRFAHNVACVQHAATRPRKRPTQLVCPGPFSDAVLSNRSHTTWLRDVYPGEARFLTIEGAQNAAEGNNGPVQTQNAGQRHLGLDGAVDVAALTRRTAVSATPLRRGKEVGPAGEGGDVFLKSALKLVDRYQLLPQSRAHILGLLDRYKEVVASTNALKQKVNETAASIPAGQQLRTDQFTSLKQAEQSVREAEARVAEARRQRDALRLRLHNLRNPEQVKAKQDDLSGTSFSTDPWATPSSASFMAESPSLLRNEHLPSGLNFGQNLYSSTNARTPSIPARSQDAAEDAFWSGGKADPLKVDGDASLVESSAATEETTEDDVSEDEEEEEEEEETEEETVILSLAKPLPRRAASPPPQLPSRTLHLPQQPPDPPKEPATPPDAPVAKRTIPQQVPVLSEAAVASPAPREATPIIYPQLEAIAAKIWKSVGEVILPGNSFGSSPPKVEDTIKTLREQTAAPNLQPANACTAQLLLSMLCVSLNHATPDTPLPPVPMSELKKDVEELAQRRGFDRPADYGMKVVYQCVAKKLLKLDRTKNPKDPMVGFDPS